jgi:hypothetical protein
MTIEVWNVVLSAVILVLMTGGGIWLRYVVEQQLKAKDTTIEALKGVVQLKDAHISALQGDTAPAIVRAYTEMRQHANQTTEDYQDLVRRYKDVASKMQLADQLVPAQTALRQVDGLKMASDILHKHFANLLFPDGKNPNPSFSAEEPLNMAVYDAFLNAGIEMSTESLNRSKAAYDIVKPIEKSLTGES